MIQIQQKIELNPALSIVEKEVILSQQSKRIRDCSEHELSNILNESISRVYFQTGQAINANTLILEIKELIPDLQKYFPTICINEIQMFFKQGIDGASGEYCGLNCKTYRQWLRNGMSNANRLNAMKLQNKYIEELSRPKELTQAEKDKIVRDGVFLEFNNYKKTKQLIDFGNVNYNYLDKLKIIPLTIERKKEFYKQAERSIREALSKSLLNCKEGKVKTIKDELENMDIDKIKSEAKKLALIDFFDSLIETGAELKDLL